MDDAQGAVAELYGHRAGIVGVEAVVADRTALGLVEGLQPRPQRGDVETGAEGDEVEDVDADIAEDAARAMGRRQPPQPSLVGPPVAPVARRQPALQIARGNMPDVADLARLDHPPRHLDGMGVAVGQVDHVDHASRLCRRNHFEGVGRMDCQRLLAEHRLAVFEDLQRRRLVDLIGRCVDHRLETAPGQRGVEIVERMRDAVHGGEGPGPFGLGVTGRDDGAAGDRAEMLGMAMGDAAGAEDQDALRTRRGPGRRGRPAGHRKPASPSLWSEAPRCSIGSGALSTGTFGAFDTSDQAGTGL